MLIKLDSNNFVDTVSKTVNIVKAGGIVIAPFDTVYGIICDPRNDRALKKIFELKKRPLGKTIGLATDSVATLESIISSDHAEFPDHPDFPAGTFIFKTRADYLSKYCLENGTVAIRIPNSELIRAIAKASGGVVAQTSANLSGQPICSSVDEIKKQFSPAELDQVDLIIDGGQIAKSAPSKIYDLTGNEPVEIAR